MLERYLRHNRGLRWLQFPVLLTFLLDLILDLLVGHISLTVLNLLAVVLLLGTAVQILYRKTNIYFFGILEVILDLALLLCISSTLMPLKETDGPFEILRVIYTVFHLLKRLGIDNRVLYLADFLIFTTALPGSFPPIFSLEFGIFMAVLVCIYICRSLSQIMRRMGPASVRIMATMLLVLTPIHFILALWSYLSVSLSTVTYTLAALWILFILTGYKLQRSFLMTPLVLSVTNGDMIGAAPEAAQQERQREDIGTILNTRPLIGIDIPWAILDDNSDTDLDSSSDTDSDYSNPRIPAVFRTIRDRRTPRAIGDPIPLPPSPGEVAAAEAYRRRARTQAGDPPTTPVSGLTEVAEGQSALPPFRRGRPTGNLPEFGTPTEGTSRLHQRLTRLADELEGTRGAGMHTSTLENNRDSFERRRTTLIGGTSQPITQPELLPGASGVEVGERPSEGGDVPEADSPGSLRLPTLPPAGQGRHVTTFDNTASVRTASPPDSGPGPLDQSQPQPRPDTPPPPQPPRVRFLARDRERRPRHRRPEPSRFVGQEPAPDFVVSTVGAEDPFVPTIPDTSDPRQPRPAAYRQPGSPQIPSSTNSGRQGGPSTASPGSRRSPLLPHTFLDPSEDPRTPPPAATTVTADPITTAHRRPRTPTDWEFATASTSPSLHRTRRPDPTTPTRRPRNGGLPRLPHTPPNTAEEITVPAPPTTSTNTAPSTNGGQRGAPEALPALGYQQTPASTSGELVGLGVVLPSSPSPRRPRPPQRFGGSGADQSGSQTPAPTLAEIQAMEEEVARSIAGPRVRILSRGRDGQISEHEETALEIAQRQSLIDMQQRDASLPLFRQRGSAGGESSAVGGVMREDLGQHSGQQPEAEEEVPFEGRTRRRN